MTDTALPYQSQQVVNTKKKSPIIIIILGAVIIAIVIGLLFFQKPKESEQIKNVEEKSTLPSPTTKPKKEIDKKTVKIQVINGTGTPGQAGKVVILLEDLGFDLENIQTENAKEFDSTSTTIKTKNDFDDIIIDIKKALSSTFDDITSNSTLEEDSEFDIIITTGGKIYEETTPSPTEKLLETTPTEEPTSTPTEEPTPTP